MFEVMVEVLSTGAFALRSVFFEISIKILEVERFSISWKISAPPVGGSLSRSPFFPLIPVPLKNLRNAPSRQNTKTSHTHHILSCPVLDTWAIS
jgi:hypothetical protein